MCMKNGNLQIQLLLIQILYTLCCLPKLVGRGTSLGLYLYPEEVSNPPTTVTLNTRYSDFLSGIYTLLGERHNQFPAYKGHGSYLYVRKVDFKSERFEDKQYFWVIGSRISDDEGEGESISFTKSSLPTHLPKAIPRLEWNNTGTKENPLLERKDNLVKYHRQHIFCRCQEN